LAQTSSTQTVREQPSHRLHNFGVLLRSRWVVLALLAGQFALVQLLSGPQYGDAPRNLHWGVLTAENPAFLFGAPDLHERIKGFPPEPETLAPRRLFRFEPGGLHRWWGPVAPALFALVWSATGSYTLLQLVVPLAGGVAVLLTYLFAQGVLGERAGLIAAALLACFPLFREFAVISYTEALSAGLLCAALLAYLRGRTIATIVLGTLAALCKMDVLLLYFGTVAITATYKVLGGWGFRGGQGPPLAPLPSASGTKRRHHVLALLGPALLVAPWAWLHHLRGGAGGPTSGLSPGMFGLVAPQMLELLFYIPWYGALLTLAALGWCAVLGVRVLWQRGRRQATVLLCAWLALGLVVLLVYAATPGAGNSPRVVIPALPALAVLVAAGFGQLAPAWRRRIGFYLVVLFTLINLVSIGYYALEGARLRSYAPVWAVLREQPRGFVLTEQYWPALLYTRQPVTWFEADPQFERAIMHDAANFRRYVELHPIRYVVLPATGERLAAADVRAYLAANARALPAGEYVVYALR
jgi:hypothetical protein